MRIQHNIAAMNSYRNYSANTKTVAKNLEKLSSGYRINRAGDDAAGLAISEKMRAQITGLDTAQKNAKDGISLVQTAEGSLTEVHSMLNRMVELADQSANGTYDNEVDRANLQKEVTALKTEIDRVADSSNFNGIKLLNGSMGERSITPIVATAGGIQDLTVMGGGDMSAAGVTLSDIKATFTAADGKVAMSSTNIKGLTFEAVGSDAVSGDNGGTLTFRAKFDSTVAGSLAADKAAYDGMTISVSIGAKVAGAYVNDTESALAIGAATGLNLQIGDSAASYDRMTVSVGDMHTAALNINAVDIGTQSGATSALAKIKDAINTVSGTRGDLGALQNRLDHTINNLGVMQENIQDAESTVRDVDVAKEMMAYTKNNILVQSAQAMLAQANQAPQGVLQLLQ